MTGSGALLQMQWKTAPESRLHATPCAAGLCRGGCDAVGLTGCAPPGGAAPLAAAHGTGARGWAPWGVADLVQTADTSRWGRPQRFLPCHAHMTKQKKRATPQLRTLGYTVQPDGCGGECKCTGSAERLPSPPPSTHVSLNQTLSIANLHYPGSRPARVTSRRYGRAPPMRGGFGLLAGALTHPARGK